MSLNLLFNDDDKIFICNVSNYGTCDEFVGTPDEVINALTSQSREFYCVNPVRDFKRAKKEIASYQNFLFESDANTLSEQYALLPKIMELGIVRTATFSGNKSIHYVVSCSDQLYVGELGSLAAETAYKAIWAGLEQMFTKAGLTIDKSGKNPATLSRVPGMPRKDTQTHQLLLNTGNLVTAEFLKSVAVTTRKTAYVRSTESVSSLAELEAKLAEPQHQRLALEIKYPAWISANAGNYPELLRVALWTIDEMGTTPDVLLAYFEKHLVPHLQARNYHKDWELPVYDAFKMKGLL